MSDLIVSDSSPIISFARAKKVHLVKNVCGGLIIPQEVYNEIVVKGEGKPGAEEIKNAKWVSLQKPKNRLEVEELKERLGPGESEAIVLAQELKAILLADEWSTIKEARGRGIEIISTHLILIEAKKKGFIKSVKEELNELIATGFRTTSELIKKTLQKVGE